MSSWIRTRTCADGSKRRRVEYRVGGRETPQKYGGSFKTLQEANVRRRWIDGELAAGRVPEVKRQQPERVLTLRQAFEDFRASRVDVAEATLTTYRTSQERVLAAAGDIPVDRIDAAWVSRLVASLYERGAARESIRKTRAHLAMAIDFAGVTPNPVRNRSVKLPPLEHAEMNLPTAAHVTAAFSALAPKYRLPHLIYDATGMRLTELELLEWRDLDEPDRRWRVRAETEKRRRPRWVPFGRVAERDVFADALLIFEAVLRLVPREDRDPHGRVLADFNGDAYRTELRRACQACGIPVFTPNDLRHRRATLWHLGGVPAADAASWLGHSPEEHLRTYQHANLDDRREVGYGPLLFDLGAAGAAEPADGAAPGAALGLEKAPITRDV